MTRRPKIGDKFNDKSRGPYRANGFISRVNYKEREVTVQFYAKGHSRTLDKATDFEYDEYSWEDIWGMWEEWCEYWVVIPSNVKQKDWIDIAIERGLL